jgi:hypothetical protein
LYFGLGALQILYVRRLPCTSTLDDVGNGIHPKEISGQVKEISPE